MCRRRVPDIDVLGRHVVVPTDRELGHPHYDYKLRWLESLRTAAAGWLADDPDVQVALTGDWNIAPEDDDVWDMAFFANSTHVSEPERAGFRALLDWGLTDAYRQLHPTATGRFTWWDYRAGNFHKNFGMRIDHVYVSAPLAARAVAAERDREARKPSTYPGIPSDHAPVIVDFD